MKIKDTEITIVNSDITTLKLDAIVNAANNKLLMGGGVAGAIKRAGGIEVEKEAVSKGPIEIGDSIYTSGGRLAAKYVIHAATMGMDFKTDEIKIRDSFASALRLAEQLKISSVAFPALGCGVGGFSYKVAAKIMAQELLSYIRENKTSLKEVIFCLNTDEAFKIFDKLINGYLGYILHKIEEGPFITVDIIIDNGEGIVLIKRSNPPFGWAIPGGFLDYNESLEDCAAREAKEETGLDVINLKQLHTYSAPGRDPRFHTVTTVFTAQAKGSPKADSDACDAKVFKQNQIKELDLAFDHNKVLKDYFDFKRGEL